MVYLCICPFERFVIEVEQSSYELIIFGGLLKNFVDELWIFACFEEQFLNRKLAGSQFVELLLLQLNDLSIGYLKRQQREWKEIPF